MKNLLFIALAGLFLFSCDPLDRIEGIGPVVEEEISIDEFERLTVDSSIDVFISQGTELKVIAKGEQNIIDRVNRTVIGDEWIVDLENGNYKDFHLTIHIELVDIEKIITAGSGDVEITSLILDELHLQTDGSGDITVTDRIEASKSFTTEVDGSGAIYLDDIDTPKLDVDIDGSGDITLRGKANEGKVVVFGSGDLRAFFLEYESCEVKSNASGTCELKVNNELEVKIDGSGDVYYKGNPAVTQRIDGSGRVINAN